MSALKIVNLWSLHEKFYGPSYNSMGFVRYELDGEAVKRFMAENPEDRKVYERPALEIEGRLYVLDRFCPPSGIDPYLPPLQEGWSQTITEAKVQSSDKSTWTFEVPVYGILYKLSGTCYYGAGSGDGVPPVGADVEVVVHTRKLNEQSVELKILGVRKKQPA